MVEPVVSSGVTWRDYFCFPFCWQGIQVRVLIVVQSILIHSASFSNGSKVLQLERLKLQSLETYSCDPSQVSPRKSQLGLCCCCRGFSFSPCVWLSLTHTLLPSLTACIQVPSSHCGAESNVTGPGCSVLPPPSKGPVSAEGNHHHTGSLVSNLCRLSGCLLVWRASSDSFSPHFQHTHPPPTELNN